MHLPLFPFNNNKQQQQQLLTHMRMVVDVRTKLRLALGSVKDHASIGKALIFGRELFSDIEIAVVRATGHDNTPIDERYVHEILFLVSNSPTSVAFLSRRISRRLNKTQDWIVALKTLLLVHRLLRGGDRNFEQDLRNTYLCGYLHLNLHCFPRNSDNSNSFLHDYAAFLEERLGWVINQAGKLEPVLTNSSQFQFYEEKSMETVFCRLPRCQEFLDRIMDCLPFDTADFITRIALINILRESFQVYTSFSEGITTLVDSFFDFKKPERAIALEIFRRASCQSYKLSEFFNNCKRITGAKNLDYPSVRIITMECVSTMEEVMSCSQTFGNGSFSALTDSPSSMIFDVVKPSEKVIDTSREEKTGEEVLEDPAVGISASPFSCKLETKISSVWVEFDEDDTKTSCFFFAGIGNASPGFADDLWFDGLEINQGKPFGYYNPFIDPMDISMEIL
ncbi:hypothetical protein AAC387_Pa04g2503 [Persea americana]